MGGLIAIYFIYVVEQPEFVGSHKLISEALGILGMMLIGYSIFFFSKKTAFPSIYTLIPTMGTALIIMFTSAHTVVGRILSSKLLVGIGLISYSAYLWHQPLFAFARFRTIGEVHPCLLWILSALTMVLAFFSWRFIETPFRVKGIVTSRQIFCLALFGSMVLGSFGLASSLGLEVPKGEFTGGKCNVNRKNCYALKPSKFEVALWGDSYADSFAVPLGKVLNANNISLSLHVKNSCPSILYSLRNEDERLGKGFSEACYRHNQYTLEKLIQTRPKYVILANSYEYFIQSSNEAGEYILIDEKKPFVHPKTFIPSALARMVKKLNDYNITSILLTPHPKVNQFMEKYKRYQFGKSMEIIANLSSAQVTRDLLLSSLKVGNYKYKEINGLTLFCNATDEKCSILADDNTLMLFDGSHFSVELARLTATKVMDAITIAEIYPNG